MGERAVIYLRKTFSYKETGTYAFFRIYAIEIVQNNTVAESGVSIGEMITGDETTNLFLSNIMPYIHVFAGIRPAEAEIFCGKL